jgi:hypothetical protein
MNFLTLEKKTNGSPKKKHLEKRLVLRLLIFHDKEYAKIEIHL